MLFNYRRDSYREIDWIILIGELVDRDQAKELIEEFEKLTKYAPRNFILDLRGLRYMNSCGLNTLLKIRAKVIQNGKSIAVVTGQSSKIHELLIISKLKNIFNATTNLDKAIDLLSNSQNTQAA